MIADIRAVPEAVVTAIGPAPKVGWRRWDQLAALLQTGSLDWGPIIGSSDFRAPDSDAHFDYILLAASRPLVEAGVSRFSIWAHHHPATPDRCLQPTKSGKDQNLLAMGADSMGVKCRRADAVVAADLCDLHAAFLLRQNRNDLFLAEPRLPHGRLLVDELSFEMREKSGLSPLSVPERPNAPLPCDGEIGHIICFTSRASNLIAFIHAESAYFLTPWYFVCQVSCQLRRHRDAPKATVMIEIHALFIISFVAVLAPLIARLPGLTRSPSVVLQLIFGILIGPSAAGWVTSEGAIGFLGQFGLIFLFFQAGFEFNPGKIGAAPLRLGALAWLSAFVLSILFVGLLSVIGLVRAPLLIGLALPTTAFGMLLPILRESGNLDTDFGRHVLGAAAVGELGPIILAPVILAHAHDHLHQTVLSMIFLGTAIGAILFARSLRSEELSHMIARWMSDTSVLPVRVAIVILLGLVSLANELGMELILGAYTAGMIIAMMTKVEILQYRLRSIGSGFFIPLFFIVSGVEFDLTALLTSPGSIIRLIVFCAGFLIIRTIPVRLYKMELPESDLLPLALFSSSTLPLVVAMTYLGVRTGDMLPENAHALVGAAVITVAVFPTLAIALRAQPYGAVAIAAHRISRITSAQFSRFKVFFTQKTGSKPEN
jgi:Kef-type K+ transport system membrane component KefB